jgi:hypothetical protein
MATCAYCKAEETDLHENGVPICLRCADRRSKKSAPPATKREIAAALLQSLLVAVSLNDEAAREFDNALSGKHHPNGVQRIRDASARLSLSREEMMAAHTRFDNFIEHGIVPDDLKQSN